MKPKKVITRSKFNYVDFLSSFHGLVHAAENGSAEAKGFLTTMYHSFKIMERVLALPYSPHTQPRAARVDTPDAAQLQAWFDLPSEPLQSP